MNPFESARRARGLSQRGLAKMARIPFRTVQLLEWGSHDVRLSTLRRLARGLGFPPRALDRRIHSFFELPKDSVAVTSEGIAEGGESGWKTGLFNFVDAFRVRPRREAIEIAPSSRLSVRLKALLASTVEALCEEQGLEAPVWCAGIPPLANPWFVSGSQNLKAMALVESSVHFRKRNIFVLDNFLARA